MTKKKVKNSISRMFFVLLAFLVQTGWVIFQFVKLNEYSGIISSVTSVFSAIIVVYIYLKEGCSDMKLTWIMVILVFPVMGLCLYLLYGRDGVSRRKWEKSERINREFEPYIKQEEGVFLSLEEQDPAAANQSRYLTNYAKAPVFRNTDITYYKEAAEGFEAQLKAIEKAEKYVFLEYHAIEDAESFGRLKTLLAKKAAEGVEVRVFYDDVGSIGFINPDFIKEMRKNGIQCRIFNPILPILMIFMNNRDHRKITVIDGKVGFTGGYNLADKYFNLEHPYGYWKDTGIRLEGDGVKTLTVLFLQMWNFIEKTDESYDSYLKPYEYKAEETGYVQPYGDTPLDDEPVGENAYMNLIKNARKYIYFTTPYLILSNEMIREFNLAAKRGVDVRIITPGIPDKKLVYRVTRSYYPVLLSSGVKIYEYTPGFCHAKQCICDDEYAIIGTINLDYRSMYHHFENAVWMYRTSVISEMKKDFLDTWDECRDASYLMKEKQSMWFSIGNAMLRLFSTLL